MVTPVCIFVVDPEVISLFKILLINFELRACYLLTDSDIAKV